MQRKIDLTVGGYIIHNNKVLLIHHNKLNLWLPVGGHIDENETPDQALRREIKEEVNLDIVPSSIGYVTSMVFSRPDGVPGLIISLYATPVCDHVCLSSELTEYAWVTLQEARNYDLIEGIFQELEILDSKLKGENRSWEKK